MTISNEECVAVVESLIFVSSEPVTVKDLTIMLADAGIEKAEIQQAIDTLTTRYASDAMHGFELREVAGGYQFRSKAGMAQWIQRLNIPKPVKLSQPAAETLAIIAYRQPIVRTEVENIRGVDCGQVLKTLLDRELVQIVGKRDEPGNPLIYATTDQFLSIFNLKGLEDLPSLKDIQDLERPMGTAGTEATMAASIAEEFPIPEVNVEAIHEREEEDKEVVEELEAQIRDLRKLERVIFPKQETTVIAAEVADVHEEETIPAPEVPDSTAEDIGTRD